MIQQKTSTFLLEFGNVHVTSFLRWFAKKTSPELKGGQKSNDGVLEAPCFFLFFLMFKGWNYPVPLYSCWKENCVKEKITVIPQWKGKTVWQTVWQSVIQKIRKNCVKNFTTLIQKLFPSTWALWVSGWKSWSILRSLVRKLGEKFTYVEGDVNQLLLMAEILHQLIGSLCHYL